MGNYNQTETGSNSKGIMDWDAQLESDGKQRGFRALPDGDYKYTVVGFERSRYAGGEKIPPCPMAKLTLQAEASNGDVADVHCNLLLYKPLEWKLSSFFRSIGQKKRGERLVMDWSKVVGAKGRAHIVQKTFPGRDGRERTFNDVEKFYDYQPEDFEAETDAEWMPTDGESFPWD